MDLQKTKKLAHVFKKATSNRSTSALFFAWSTVAAVMAFAGGDGSSEALLLGSGAVLTALLSATDIYVNRDNYQPPLR